MGDFDDVLAEADRLMPTRNGCGGKKPLIPGQLDWLKNWPMKVGPTGPACHWCGTPQGEKGSQWDDRIVAEVGLCRDCMSWWIRDHGRRCTWCGSPSDRPLKQGICITCQHSGRDPVKGLESLVKKLWIGVMKW